MHNLLSCFAITDVVGLPRLQLQGCLSQGSNAFFQKPLGFSRPKMRLCPPLKVVAHFFRTSNDPAPTLDPDQGSK